ncbi:MAG: DUF423 domain-containing protein [Bacteriovoracia bacterium]
MRIWGVFGAVYGLLAVALGAFGAHALRERLSPRAMEIFQTATHYQFFHALALVLIASLSLRTSTPPAGLRWAGLAFATGIFVFSGSLYALALTDIKILGAITPIGGVLFLVGWSLFAISFWRM